MPQSELELQAIESVVEVDVVEKVVVEADVEVDVVGGDVVDDDVEVVAIVVVVVGAGAVK